MFVPAPYRQPATSWMVDILRGNPLALMVSNGPEAAGPYATHLPVIQDPTMTEEWSADLSGAKLLGHMNRANPHWKALADGTQVLLTFTGPHAYVSPTVYQKPFAAPTWDFTSVHVHGVLRKIEQDRAGEETLELVRSTVRAFEADFGDDWDMADSIDYFRKILPAVGAFRIDVSGAEGMFKLSQEQDPDVRERVRESFGKQESSRHREAARLMSRLPPPGCPHAA
ncbi:FMN-binding negative transcriptional regulator [Streptomyces lunaelactis]|uniref:FMN-binding negative transcriptional regulator n=1 Tax=Streptomyces lunaelactis TaxID=1535768 RepID=UPI0015850278|nr:FMN-binding negative transcriptional regulator [Streptomyces lunaelactis]NUK03476.1 FMN-binding negative transcriptional regulator [Streptomyces lunaelactis]NUK09142.1 FMN-binding negative transcriptional regulator [Streptomyces lunaelactis]NUK18372.1 FMN-binding negative transcriptional regulator [Streptomyces lunaelactis]NUK25126.1 FMN-binding negative transcriptional regulator [Streptomyces lunaelactis]NUK35308.1 FMN-binding negative transcriptional regulator [Streptomyces lunaelactis]